jgi:hypothetical protein
LNLQSFNRIKYVAPLELWVILHDFSINITPLWG